ncbi:hypothetical protein GCM10025298_06290 [Natronobiforma cellulositropha]
MSSGDDEDDDNGDDDSSDATDGGSSGSSGGDATTGDDIPGFDFEDLESIANDNGLFVNGVERDGDELFVDLVATDDVADAPPAWLSAGFVRAIGDVDEFAAEISLVHVSVTDEDGSTESFLVDVDWVLAYHEGDLSETELAQRIDDSA